MRNAKMIEEINNAIGAHGMWKLRLRTAVSTGRSEMTAKVAGCSDQCTFGKWLAGSHLDASVRAGVPYKVVSRVHAEFHQCAGKVLTHVERGDTGSARDLLEGEYFERTDKLIRALMKWKGELLRDTAIARFAA